ncbi:MAG: flavin-dependent oxidoreductase, methylene-tetrahydromethanopterin reductase [Rhodospirillales bacterium]|jgi:alkanesulfonate monooxygenase SsuD/methylene tetrahydromethanopterin reductase-like flavin-dependent oxidoreductase (luciferase family)|nr:flavin-dependent oxidoreductase, methylene-tetrahydromethanopterin reductase [Rhodospirillales bacterium]MCE3257391.1 flavin-dependent oxidoreductase, methylene-tetrahydromethanopterin reductase [Nitrobacter vulgaris]
MRVFHFSEQPYPDAWLPEYPSLRVDTPNSLCDPKIAADLYARYQDEWMLADELGMDIMVNEHHSTATCLSSSCMISLAILARITKHARLLALGVPLANRSDPLRVAEELSMIDVISRGRLEMGFVKGVPFEVVIANSSPLSMMDRLWEAHDFVLKAMTTNSGPFSWQSENINYRAVNIWPRPYQQPHPPVWITGSSPSSADAIAERGYVLATFLSGYATRKIFDVYREKYLQTWSRPAPADRLAYLALCAVADTQEEALKRAYKIAGYLRTIGAVSEAFRNPPGYLSVADNVRALANFGKPRLGLQLSGGRTVYAATASCEELIEAGLMFAGTPDQVKGQIDKFDSAMGGIGNLLLMFQGGDLGHAETMDSLTLFGRSVLPHISA